MKRSFHRIDTHTHCWEKSFSPQDALRKRYIPDGPTPFSHVKDKWQQHQIQFGVLVQVSFMGTDNSYLVERLTENRNIRGIVVVTNDEGEFDPIKFNRQRLIEYHKAGVRGIRLNLISKNTAQMDRLNQLMHGKTGSKEFIELWRFIREFNWHIEAQQCGEHWVDLIETLITTDCRIVVDHFARPDKGKMEEDPGWLAVLKAANSGRVWLKLSAAYRLGVTDRVIENYIQQAVKYFGVRRLLWGSDYPFTGFSQSQRQNFDYGLFLSKIEKWVPSESDQKAIFQDTPAHLYEFSLTS